MSDIHKKFEITPKEIANIYPMTWNHMMLHFQLNYVKYGILSMPMKLFAVHEYTNYMIKRFQLNPSHKTVLLKQLEYITTQLM